MILVYIYNIYAIMCVVDIYVTYVNSIYVRYI